jgi:hypothetical protein
MAGAIVQPTAVFLGAGFSKWAAGLPIAQGLLDFRVATLNRREQRRLELLRLANAKWNSENPGAPTEKFVSQMIRGSDRTRRAVLWYITRRLSDPFVARMLGGRQTLMIDDARSRNLTGVRRANRFIQSVAWAPLSGIVTPNYDLLVEYALGTAGFNYGQKGEVLYGRGKNPWFPWQGAWPVLSGDLPVAKIHGSISWDQTTRYTDGRCGVRGDALIVPPYAGKRRLPVLQEIWKLAGSILSSSCRAIVFGFGFNSYDRQLLRLLARAGSQFKAVLIVDTDAKLEAARELWPGAEITACQPPPAGDRLIAAWVKNLFALESNSG